MTTAASCGLLSLPFLLVERKSKMTAILIVLAVLVATLVYLGLIYKPPDMSQYDQPKAELVMPEEHISPQHEDVVKKLAGYHSLRLTDIDTHRRGLEELFSKDVGADIRPVDVNGVPGEWVLAEGADPSRRLLYLHGGAFKVGSPRSHRYITSELSKRAGVAVLAVDYRKHPEHKVIACHEDARIAYSWILQNGPEGASSAGQLFVAGDSAGGNLTLAVIAWANANGHPPAQGAIALAPLTDATFSSPSWRTNKKTDPFLAPGLGELMRVPRLVLAIGSRYRNGMPPNHPEISPLFGPLGDLPPTLIQVSRHEMLYDDAQRYANRAAAEGGDVTLQVWPKLVHVFQAFPELPEAQDALDKAAEFIRRRSAGLQTEAA